MAKKKATIESTVRNICLNTRKKVQCGRENPDRF